jgi:hypothetical protein
MKKRYLFAIPLIVMIIVASLYGLLEYAGLNPEDIETMHIVPDDAVYVVKTRTPIESWHKLSNSTIWTHLQRQNQFAEVTQAANYMTEVINDHKHLLKLLDNHEVVISAHPFTTPYFYRTKDGEKKKGYKHDYDFIFTVNMGYVATASSFVEQNIDYFLTDDYEGTRPELYEGYKIHTFIDSRDKTEIHLAFIENLLLCSFTKKLLKKAIDQKAMPNFINNKYFTVSGSNFSNRGLADIYLQYDFLNALMLQFMESQNEYVVGLGKTLGFTSLNMKVTDEEEQKELRMSGATTVKDSVQSYFRAMLISGKGRIKAPRIIPQSTSFYFSLTFEDFATFQENLDAILQENEGEYEANLRNVRRVENFLSTPRKGINITLQEHFFSWIGDEIAVIEVPSKDEAGRLLASKDQFAVFLKANSISKAKQNLAILTNQVRKKTPIKFRDFDYRGHTISSMFMKGFFKMIMGKYFSKIEKPYFTVIEEYVVFSNHPQTLKTIIDEYEVGLTLAKSEEFRTFFNKFSASSNAFVYSNTPAMRRSLSGFFDPETRASMKINRNFIDCFPQVGFQISEYNGEFKTDFIARYEHPAKVHKTEQEFISRRANLMKNGKEASTLDKLFNAFDDDEGENQASALGAEAHSSDMIAIDNIKVKNVYTRKKIMYYDGAAETKKKYEVRVVQDSVKDGIYKEYYPSGKLKVKGRYRKDLKEGVWVFYDEDGSLDGRERYRKGEEQ